MASSFDCLYIRGVDSEIVMNASLIAGKDGKVLPWLSWGARLTTTASVFSLSFHQCIVWYNRLSL
eukprot:scaffold15051_cov144-Amphora_coffeaeformis.AAC.2